MTEVEGPRESRATNARRASAPSGPSGGAWRTVSRISERRVRLFRAYGGCRVGRVIDEERTVEGRPSATVTIRTAARRWHVQVRAGG